MQIKLETVPIEQVEADALVVPIFDKESPGGGLPSEAAQTANDLAGGWIESCTAAASSPARSSRWPCCTGRRDEGRRLLVVGAGKSDRFTPAVLRKVLGGGAFPETEVLSTIALALDAGNWRGTGGGRGGGAILGDFEPDQYKTDKKDAKSVEAFTVVVPKDGEALAQAIESARILAEAQNFARTLVYSRPTG